MSATVNVSVDKPRAVLTVVNPSGQRARVLIQRTPFQIGRQSDNHLVLRDNRISRAHARITTEGDDYYIEDLESRHGLFVNGQRVTRHKLETGQGITFGFPDSYTLIFTHEEADLGRLLDSVVTQSRGAADPAASLAKLRALVEVARALQHSLTIEEVLESVVDAALTVTGSERGFLLLKEVEDLEVKVARDRAGSFLNRDELKVPTRLIHNALRHRRELLSMDFDVKEEGAGRADSSVSDLELRSVVCVPLVRVRTGLTQETLQTSLNETVGLIYLDSKGQAADLSASNRELLQSLALEASTVLENARLLDQERARQRLEDELRIARSIQQSLLPRSLPETGWFRVAGSSLPTHQVGGDYFDVSRIRDDCWATVVADVSGKGVSSALLAALFQGAFLTAAEDPGEIESLLGRLNVFLHERTEGEKYATLFYCTLDNTGLLRWSNAGHCPPLVLRTTGEMEALPATGVPIGLMESTIYEVQAAQLRPGDKVVVYSNGFSELRNAAGELFDARRIKGLLQQNAARSCSQLHLILLSALRDFTGGSEQADDITLVVIEYQTA